jgi:hypothetical protein
LTKRHSSGHTWQRKNANCIGPPRARDDQPHSHDSLARRTCRTCRACRTRLGTVAVAPVFRISVGQRRHACRTLRRSGRGVPRTLSSARTRISPPPGQPGRSCAPKQWRSAAQQRALRRRLLSAAAGAASVVCSPKLSAGAHTRERPCKLDGFARSLNVRVGQAFLGLEGRWADLHLVWRHRVLTNPSVHLVLRD